MRCFGVLLRMHGAVRVAGCLPGLLSEIAADALDRRYLLDGYGEMM